MIADLRAAARALGGEFVGRDSILCPGPGHGPRDRSLSLKINTASPDGFTVHGFAGGDVVIQHHLVADLVVSLRPREGADV
jgi:hypothetical protein